MSVVRRPTMRDVANLADVSFKTVSRVVNNEGGVSASLVKRVEDAVAELGYRIDDRARNLRTRERSADTIGFVLVDVSNPFFGGLLRGIEEMASERGCLVLSGSTDRDPVREQQLIESFVGRRVDGLVIVYSGSNSLELRSEAARGLPVVFLDLEPEGSTMDLVRSDHYGGAKLATEHLLAHGHTDIAFFADDGAVFSATLRQQGFVDAMAEAGIDVSDNRMVTGSHSSDEWQSIVFDHLDSGPHPTAIFSAQNTITVGTIAALHARGLRNTIAQVGFDDIALADVLSPGITVVQQDPLELGRRAAERLFARIDGEDGPPVKQIMNSPLVERGSGEIRPLG